MKLLVSFEVQVDDDLTAEDVTEAVRTVLTMPLGPEDGGLIYNWCHGLRIIEEKPVEVDWRGPHSSFYKAPEGHRCEVCGSTEEIGVEAARFGYAVCKTHSLLSPVQVGQQRKFKN